MQSRDVFTLHMFHVFQLQEEAVALYDWTMEHELTPAGQQLIASFLSRLMHLILCLGKEWDRGRRCTCPPEPVG